MEVIASKCLSNTESLSIYVIDTSLNRVLVGLNLEKPRWHMVYTGTKFAFFTWCGVRMKLADFVRFRFKFKKEC